MGKQQRNIAKRQPKEETRPQRPVAGMYEPTAQQARQLIAAVMPTAAFTQTVCGLLAMESIRLTAAPSNTTIPQMCVSALSIGAPRLCEAAMAITPGTATPCFVVGTISKKNGAVVAMYSLSEAEMMFTSCLTAFMEPENVDEIRQMIIDDATKAHAEGASMLPRMLVIPVMAIHVGDDGGDLMPLAFHPSFITTDAWQASPLNRDAVRDILIGAAKETREKHKATADPSEITDLSKVIRSIDTSLSSLFQQPSNCRDLSPDGSAACTRPAVVVCDLCGCSIACEDEECIEINRLKHGQTDMCNALQRCNQNFAK